MSENRSRSRLIALALSRVLSIVTKTLSIHEYYQSIMIVSNSVHKGLMNMNRDGATSPVGQV